MQLTFALYEDIINDAIIYYYSFYVFQLNGIVLSKKRLPLLCDVQGSS